jgi:hypothetical protein
MRLIYAVERDCTVQRFALGTCRSTSEIVARLIARMAP